MESEGVKVDKRVSAGDAGGVIRCGSIVGDVGVEDAVFEPGERFYENTVGIGEDGEDGALGVSERIDDEELPAGGGERSRAEDVPHAAGDPHGRGSHT